jgi:hypothetical protein
MSKRPGNDVLCPLSFSDVSRSRILYDYFFVDGGDQTPTQLKSRFA